MSHEYKVEGYSIRRIGQKRNRSPNCLTDRSLYDKLNGVLSLGIDSGARSVALDSALPPQAYTGSCYRYGRFAILASIPSPGDNHAADISGG